MHKAGTKWRRICVAWIYTLMGILFILLNGEVARENEVLLLALNTIFTGIIPLSVAFIAGYSFIHSKNLSILLMSCGMLVLGVGSMLTGMVRLQPGSENAAVTIYNLCILFSAACHFAAAVKAVRRGSYNVAVMRVLLPAAYLIALLFIMGLYVAVKAGALPPFIDQNGGTRLRSVVLWVSVTGYLTSFLELRGQFQQQKRDYLFWYAHSLMMIAVGLVIVFLSTGVGTLTGWVGRGAHYTSALFALYAMMGVSREVKRKGRSMAYVMEDFLLMRRMAIKAWRRDRAAPCLSLINYSTYGMSTPALPYCLPAPRRNYCTRCFLICFPIHTGIRSSGASMNMKPRD